jgi:transposase
MKGETMAGKRETHPAAFEAQVALAAVKGDETVDELASRHGIHPTLIHAWEKQLLAGSEDLFGNGGKAVVTDHEALQAQLYEQIGRPQMELGWKKLTITDYGAVGISGEIRPGRRTPRGPVASRHGSGAGSASPPDFATRRWPARSPGATA